MVVREISVITASEQMRAISKSGSFITSHSHRPSLKYWARIENGVRGDEKNACVMF